jgi:hypothetical protein
MRMIQQIIVFIKGVKYVKCAHGDILNGLIYTLIRRSGGNNSGI